MAFSIQFPAGIFATTPLSALILICIFAIWSISAMRDWCAKRRIARSLPFATLDGQDPLESWFKDGNKLIEEGLRKYSGPFQIQTGTGPKVIVRNEHVDEYAKSPAMSVKEALRVDAFADYPGFEAARVSVHSSVIRDTLLGRFTPALDAMRDSLVADAKACVTKCFGESTDWTSAAVQPLVLDIVTRMSSRPFAGPRLCQNPRWLEVQKQYACISFTAASELRRCPGILRPIRHWFIPGCVSLRKFVRDARRLMEAELQARRFSEESEAKSFDAISWLNQQAKASKTDVDIVAAQLQLSMVAIQTTSHVLNHALHHVAEHKEFQAPLREEINAVISEHGWTKSGLYHLKLMDSFLKESLRISQGHLAMARVATKHTVFADGSFVPKGAGCMLEANFQNSTLYPQPSSFDPSRFARMRDCSGKAQSWQYVSTSSEDLGFGYGPHSCPGRFFASNVVKIAFAYLLMQYDWDVDSSNSGVPELETESIKTVSPEIRLKFRYRQRGNIEQEPRAGESPARLLIFGPTRERTNAEY